MLDLETISVIIFFALIALLLIRYRGKYEFNHGLIIKRWQRGKEVIDKLIGHKRILAAIGNFGIIVSLLASLSGLYFLFQYTIKLESAFQPVLPSVGGFDYPGPIISIPFWYWIIGIFIIIFFHESMHAVFVRLEKIKLKSYGVMLFFVLPIGAFVDPDENALKRLGLWKKLRILAAGSFANIVLSFVFLLLSFVFFANMYTPTGVGFTGLVNNSPAFYANLTGTIVTMDSTPMKTAEDFSHFLSQNPPGSEIKVTTTKG